MRESRRIRHWKQAPMATTETIDGIVYETVDAPAQTY